MLASSELPLQVVSSEHGARCYPALADFLERDWQANVVAILDALRTPERAMPGGARASVYAVSFAAD